MKYCKFFNSFLLKFQTKERETKTEEKYVETLAGIHELIEQQVLDTSAGKQLS